MKKEIIRIVIALVLLVAAVLIEKNTAWKEWQYLLIFLVPYLIVGLDTLKEAFESLMEGEALDEDFLMSVATIGALSRRLFYVALTRAKVAVNLCLANTRMRNGMYDSNPPSRFIREIDPSFRPGVSDS